MSGTTANEGLPYPLTTDFADVQDAYRLAIAVDRDLREDQAPLRAFMGRPSFIARSTSNGSGFTSGQQSLTFGAIDWDNTGGVAIGDNSWRQPLAQQPSWWLFGATMFVANTGGPVIGDGVMARITVTTLDQVTGVETETDYYQRNDESNTAGEWINIFAMAPLHRGSATIQLLLNGSTTKATGSGSRFWGMQLGPVT